MYDLTIVIEARLLNRFGKPSQFLYSTTLKENFTCEDMEDVMLTIDRVSKEFEVVSANFRRVKSPKDDCLTRKEYYEEDEC